MRMNPWLELFANITVATLRSFLEFLGTFGWIQMRYEGEPMAQINCKYYRSGRG
jgi:hypothetical protein